MASPTITRVNMTRRTFDAGRPQAPRLLIVHATAGGAPGDYNWLRKGGGIVDGVDVRISIHYYVDKAGVITQFVDDGDTAWHCGKSSWTIDGVRYTDLNPLSLGIEISNRSTGNDPYPVAQFNAVVALARHLVDKYGIAPGNLARHSDIAPGRKTDPAGFPWARFVAEVYAPPPAPPLIPVTADATLLSPPRCSLEQARRLFAKRGPWGEYTSADVLGVILPAYWQKAQSVGLDPCLAVAQMAHETGWLNSFWSQRPQRNPAGIGVTGEAYPHKPANASGYRFNPQRSQWEKGLSFGSWVDDSVPAHVGRLLAWALPPGTGTPEQRAAVNRALAYRALTEYARGSAPRLKALGRVHNATGIGWASPGTRYGEAIAAVMNEMRGL
jgi:hypothetical protein